MISDRELLELVAQEARPVRPDLVEEVVVLARQTQRRRKIKRSVVAAGATLAAAAAVALWATVWSGPDRQRLEPRPNLTTAPKVDASASAYAAVIEDVVSADMAQSPLGPRPRVLYVLDHTCEGVDKQPPLTTCAGPALPTSVRRGLSTALAGYAPVEFVPDQRGPTGHDANLTTINDGVQVTLGPIRMGVGQAQVPLAIRRNGQDGTGGSYRVVELAGRWVISRGPTSGWIS